MNYLPLKHVELLECEFCKQKSLFFYDFNQTENKCLNESCGKLSKISDEVKNQIYTDILEKYYITNEENKNKHWNERARIGTQRLKIKTRDNGYREITINPFDIQRTRNDVQWAVSERKDHFV